MDTSIILFIIFGLIVWFDAKRRSKTIAQRWEDVGGKLTVFSKPKPKIETFIELKFMNAPENVDEDEDDIIIKEAVKEVMAQKVDTSDAESALRRLGYKQRDITKVIKIITEETLSGGKSTEDIITKALAFLNS
jgi:hypothetical protein